MGVLEQLDSVVVGLHQEMGECLDFRACGAQVFSFIISVRKIKFNQYKLYK